MHHYHESYLKLPQIRVELQQLCEIGFVLKSAMNVRCLTFGGQRLISSNTLFIPIPLTFEYPNLSFSFERCFRVSNVGSYSVYLYLELTYVLTETVGSLYSDPTVPEHDVAGSSPRERIPICNLI